MDTSSQSGLGSADQLLALQRLALRNVNFSITRDCPLRCAHCITLSGPGAAGRTLRVADAEAYARQLPALAAAGVAHLSFTGGEPVLGIAAIEVLATAARAAGMATSVVTSGAWARSRTAALRVLRRLAAVGHWDVGYDRFHEAYLPLVQLAVLVDAFTSEGTSFSLRVCVERPSSVADEELIARLRALVGPNVPIIRQATRRLGRAAEWQPGRPTTPLAALEPCPSSGPLVREDGTVAPCCAGLAYPLPRRRQPFDLGNALATGLAASRDRWARDPLLRLLRLVGFGVPLEWISEADPALLPRALPATACELCVKLWDDEGRVAALLRERAARPDVASELDRLERELFS